MKNSDSPNRKREIFGWAMYDFANSSFATTIIAAVLPIYFAAIVPQEGVSLKVFGFQWTSRATSLWAYSVACSMFIVAITAPVLGAIADTSRSKKRFLFVYCYIGCVFTALLFFVQFGDYWLAMFLFAVANIAFAGSNVFYNAFLPEIAKGDEIDWISGKGFAYGYCGGGTLLAINFAMIAMYSRLGIGSKALATRLCFLSVGLWWGTFAIPTFLFVRERSGGTQRQINYVRTAFGNLADTFRQIRRFRDLLIFLVAFLIYNDGIQTVIAMAAIFGREELGLSQESLLGALLMIQFIGVPGTIGLSWIAKRLQAKRTIMLTLIIWAGVVIYGYFMSRAVEFWILGGIVGLILGGSQAISRSLYGRLLPVGKTAEFYGFFSICGRFASIFGPLLFGIVRDLTGNSRISFLSIISFFLIGLALLNFVNIPRGIAAAQEEPRK